MIILDCEQLSEEWFSARCGTPSASNFDKIVTTKGAPSKQVEKYLYQLAGERITGIKEETYQNAAMLRGIELEGEARDLFKFVKGIEVQEVGICYPDENKRFSCSPDGLVGIEIVKEGLEIKCPALHTHVAYLLGGKLPTEYTQQVQGSMLVTGYFAWFFMSYYPGMPPFIVRVYRNNDFCAKLKVALDEFCDRLDQVEAKIRGMV